MLKATKITGAWRKEFTKVFYQARCDVAPWLNEYKVGDIDVRWWEKPKRNTRMGLAGKCFRGTWQIRLNGRMQFTRNLILLDIRLVEQPDELVKTWKHELIHLVKQSRGHDRLFNNLIATCGAHRYHGFNKEND